MMVQFRNDDASTLKLQKRRDISRLPTIVYIHGDSYEWGSGNPYDGSVLAGFGEVIVVTLNYRLGILGFLPAMEGTSRGNYGLLDQIAALHWVQENIAQFGGDPRNITVLGHGYGASCAHLLMYSPKAQGLFQRVILQSGSAFSPWALAHETMTFSRGLGRSLGCRASDHNSLIKCLRLRPLSDFKRVQIVVPEYLTSFGPMVDGVVIPEDPEKLALYPPPEMQNTPKIDVMMGVTRVEAFSFFAAADERYGLEAVRRDRMLRTLVRNLFTFHLQEIFLTIVNEYTDWTRPVQHPVNILDGTIDAMTDALVVAPSVSSANLFSKMNHRTFLYVFNYPSDMSEFPQRVTCVHGDDMPYIFGAPLVQNMAHFSDNYTKSEIALSEAMMTFWSNFAKSGDPNIVTDVDIPDKLKSRYEKIDWPMYDSVNQKYLSLSLKPKVRDHYHAHRLSFWLSLIPKLHRQGSATEVASQHHLLDDHDNPNLYDGVVRQGSVLPPIGVPPRLPTTMKPKPNVVNRTSVGSGAKVGMTHYAEMSYSSQSPYEASYDEPFVAFNYSNFTNMASTGNDTEEENYDGLLQITITVGCTLLFFNICIYFAVYYQRAQNRAKLSMKTWRLCKSRSSNQSDIESSQGSSKTPSIRAPPPSPETQRASDLPLYIPPPPSFVHTSPPVSAGPSPTMIPLQDLSSALKTFKQEQEEEEEEEEEENASGLSHPTKVHWAPDVGCEADRDAVWL
ncbi:neuroligin-4, Y-linked [Nephila pilipes]|uniref:Neuroligin-4, Y-linked n=1 Tax=Nephila pilipes TaxID=299642 RepID=A0A8X6PCD7_NEPPI|nr:neuroligin-4, Y-linked [Nephila pilipes]